MSRPTRRLPSVGHRLLVALQVLLLLATFFAPIPAAAEEPSSDPGASPTPSTEPASTPEPTSEPTVGPTAEPTPEPTAEPTPEPTAEPPAATPDPTPEETTPTPHATSEPTPSPTSEPSAPAGTPTIKSDLEDYPPGGLVTLTGTGWQPGESVHIFVNDDWGSSWSRHVDVTADASGAITDQFNLPNWFVAEYSVTASGSMSGVATTTFTDARIVTTATLNGATTVTVDAGGSINAIVNVTTNGSGANARWRSTSWTIQTADPTTVNVGNCVDTLNHDPEGAYTESFAIAAPATPGTYNAYFKAHADDTCGGAGGGASELFELTNGVVARRPTTTAITSSSNPSVFGSPVTFTATVTGTGGNPSGVGTVNFMSGAASVCSAVPLSGNTATCSTSTLTVSGSPHVITAQYSGTSSGSPQFASSTGTLTPGQSIAKAPSVTDVTCPAGPYTYNGDAQTPCSVSVTGAGGLNLSPTPDYANNVNAGTATASYTYGGDANHTGSSDSATFTIDQASSTVTVSCPANVTYTGTAHEPCTAEATGIGMSPVDVTDSLVYTANTDAGTATADASWDGDANHTGDTGTATFTIDKAASTTTVSCPAGPYTYTGSAQEPCSASVTGVGGLSETLTVSYTDNTDAGTATAAASYAGDANHLDSSDSETFTIGKAGPTIVVSGYDVTFDGAPHTATGTAKGVLDEDLAGLDLSGTTHTNAGTYSDTWTFTDTTGNYVDASGSVTDKIAKAPSTTTVSCPASVVYTGSALTPCSAEVTGAGGLSQTLTVSYANNTFVGTSTASASHAGDANHHGSNASTTFEITTAFRIIGFDSPVDMTIAGDRIYNSVKNGQTVPLKFRVFNLDGTEVTSVIGLSAMSRSITCLTGDIDPTLLPIVSTTDTGLRRTGDRFHFNWSVPKGAGKCFQILVKTVDGSTTMVGSMSGTPVQEAYFKSK
jgi:Bacterial Ig-like domain (group 3)